MERWTQVYYGSWRVATFLEPPGGGESMRAGHQKPNTRAIAGFLSPFLAAGITAGLVLGFARGLASLTGLILYLTIVPLLLVAGLILSLRSIPFIQTMGDKDYAYSGLTLNLLFITAYLASLIPLLNAAG